MQCTSQKYRSLFSYLKNCFDTTSLTDSITVSLLLTGACDRIVKHFALRRRQSGITTRLRPPPFACRTRFSYVRARRKRVCTANNKQPSASTGFSIARVNEERRKEHTEEQKEEKGIFGAFCRKRGRFRNLNMMHGDTGTEEGTERNLCRVCRCL